jgi:hypothetical protein
MLLDRHFLFSINLFPLRKEGVAVPKGEILRLVSAVLLFSFS